jgi:hypothetical protein
VRIRVRSSRGRRIGTGLGAVVVGLLSLPLAAVAASAATTPGMPRAGVVTCIGIAAALVALCGLLGWRHVRPVFLSGSLVIGPDGLRLDHRGLLKQPYELPRAALHTAVLDDGGDRDDEGRPARFRVAQPWSADAGVAGWLWSTGMRGFVPELCAPGDTPNLALVLTERHAAPALRRRTPQGPLKRSGVGGLLLTVDSTPQLRRALADAGFGPRIEHEDAVRLYTAFLGETVRVAAQAK